MTSSTTPRVVKAGLVAGGIGLLAWGLARNRTRLKHGLARVRHRIDGVVPAVRGKLQGVGDMRALIADYVPSLHQLLTSVSGGKSKDEFASVGTPDPGFGSIEPPKWHELGLDLFHRLQDVGVGNSRLCNELELSTNSVYDMKQADFAHLLSWTRQNHPEILRQLLERHPWAADALQF